MFEEKTNETVTAMVINNQSKGMVLNSTNAQNDVNVNSQGKMFFKETDFKSIRSDSLNSELTPSIREQPDSGEDQTDMGMRRGNDTWESRGAIPKSVQNRIIHDMHVELQESSDSDEDGITYTGIEDYRVKKKDIEELETHTPNRPHFFSQISSNSLTCKIISNEEIEEVDGKRIESVSSLDTNKSDYKIMRRKSAILKIARNTDFFKLQTVKYTYRQKTSRQHYMKCLPEEENDVEGDIGLRPGDMLLTVNKKSLQDKKQKKVLKIFRHIGPNEDGKIYIEIIFQRWENRFVDGRNCMFEVDYLLHLILEPDISDIPIGAKKSLQHVWRWSVRNRGEVPEQTYKVAKKVQQETCREVLPKGQIENIESRGQQNHRIQPLQFEEEFVTVHHDGLVCLEVWNEATASKNVFEFHFFRGMDKSQEPLSQFIYCTRISCSGPVGTRFLTSDMAKHTELIFHISKTQRVTCPSDVDESCFILRERGDEVLFESLLHRGFYICCEKQNSGTTKFVMTQKSKHDVIHDIDLDRVKFKLWPVNAEKKTFFHAIIETQLVKTLSSCTGRSSQLHMNH